MGKNLFKKVRAINNTIRSIWVINKNFENKNEFDIKELVKKVRNGYDSTILSETDDSYIIEETEKWKSDLKQILYEMDPFEFEKLSQLLLREAGFSQVEVTKKTGDGGIDGFGKFKINGLISFKLAFQCKRYRGQVPPDEIRDFRGSMTTDVEKGIFITTGSFSQKAKEEASANGKKHIDLIDGEQLLDKLAELGLGVKEEKIYVIDKDFFSNFN